MTAKAKLPEGFKILSYYLAEYKNVVITRSAYWTENWVGGIETREQYTVKRRRTIEHNFVDENVCFSTLNECIEFIDKGYAEEKSK